MRPLPKKLTINRTLFPKQAQIEWALEESPAVNVGGGGAMGGGKSGGGRSIMLGRCFKYPGTRHLILRRVHKQLVDNHIEPLFRDYPDLRQFYLKSDLTLHLPNGSDLVFGYAEHPAKNFSGDIYSYQGSEWATIFPDEASHFNQEELTFLQTRCRWPGMKAKMLLTFNPGGIGTSYLKRVFIDRRFEPEENPSDYFFVKMYGWDNVEWVRQWLEERSIPIDDYYNKLTDEQRKSIFLNHSAYGRVLGQMKGKMRQAYLEGSFDAFQGQYFQDAFSYDLHVRYEDVEIWHERSIGIDWGFGHNACVHWGAQVAPEHLHVYRELLRNGMSGKALAQLVVDFTPEHERPSVRAIGLSHDAFARKDERDPINVQMDSVFSKNGLPTCTRAGGDPMGTAVLIYTMFGDNNLSIDPSCTDLIRTIPEVQRDPKNPNSTLKFEGDDSYDSFKHLCEARTGFKSMPLDYQVQAEANLMGDPLRRYLYLKSHLGQQPKAVVEVDYAPAWFRQGEQ
jgi:hypothetical protein